MGGAIDPEDDKQYVLAVAKLTALATWLQAEYIAQEDPSTPVKALAAEDLSRFIGDLVTLRAIRRLVERHGGAGPWSAEDIASIAGCDLASVRRVLRQMAREGFPTPPESG